MTEQSKIQNRKSKIKNGQDSAQRAGESGSGDPMTHNPKSAIENPKSEDSAERIGAGGSGHQMTVLSNEC
jgi:hypothetical protein